MNEQAKQIIGILEGGGKVCNIDNFGNKSVILDRIGKTFYGRWYVECNESWDAIEYNQESLKLFTNIRPLKEKREEEGKGEPYNHQCGCKKEEGCFKCNDNKPLTYPKAAKAAINQAIEGGEWNARIRNEDIFVYTICEDEYGIYFEHTGVIIDGEAVWINKDWAKAFYGTHKVDEEGNRLDYDDVDNDNVRLRCSLDEFKNSQEAWQYHLKKQVMEDNQLDYIAKHLQ